MDQISLFEDHSSSLKPLTLTRPASDLRIGIFTIAEKWKAHLPGYFVGHSCNSVLQPLYPGVKKNDETLHVNSMWLPEAHEFELAAALRPNQGYLSGDTILAYRGKDIDKIHFEQLDARLVKRPWDLFLHNFTEIQRDATLLNFPALSTQANRFPGVLAEQADRIFVHETASMEPGVVLIASEGPIILGPNSKVLAGSLIKGPFSLGEGAVLKMGAKIYGGTSIGPYCKVGGEVQNVIFHSYSNKGHDGYLGNSVIGQWCNIGAGTDSSNLKNNYSEVKAADWESREMISTGQQFFGCAMGDHTKVAIGSRLNTGSMIGAFANIFASGFPPKLIPSFSWLSDEGNQRFRLDKALEMGEKMMARRGIELTPDYQTLIEELYKMEYF